MFQKKNTPFYFCNNIVIREPIFIIFGSNMPDEICNKTYIVFLTSHNCQLFEAQISFYLKELTNVNCDT